MAQAGNSNRKRTSSGNQSHRNVDSRSADARNVDRRNAARYEEEQQAQKSREMKVEIMTIIFVAIMLLLFLCNFHIIGSFGEAVSGFLFGVFGLLAYIAPVFIGVLYFFFKANPGNHRAYKKLSAVIGLYFLIGIICDMASKTAVGMDSYSFTELYKLGRDGRCGGGLVSGSLAFAIKSFLGEVGLVLLLILGIIVCLIVITDKSLIEFIKNKYAEFTANRPSREVDYNDRRHELAQENVERLPDKALTVRDKMKAEADKSTDVTLNEESDNYPLENTIQDRQEEINNIQVPEQPVYKKNMRESLAEKLQQSKEKRAEDKRRRAEEKENNEILKIQPPIADIPADLYVQTQDVHEITYNDEAADDYSYDPQPVEYKEPVRTNNYSQPHRIPKQDIRSEHNVSMVDQYEPMDGYNPESYPEKVQEPVQPILSQEDSEIISSRKRLYATLPATTEEPANNIPVNKAPDIDEVIFGEQKNIFDEDVQKSLAKPRTESSAIKNTTSNANTAQGYSNKPYKFPPINLLKPGKPAGKADKYELENTKINLQETLRTFGVNVDITEAVQGPSVTRYEMTLEPGTKVSKILGLSDDIKLSLASEDIRIEAPIPGKSAVGIEVPNKENSIVSFRELIENINFKEAKSTLSFAVGKNIGGEVIVTDIAKMPHVLIAGATGSGKSVCINTLIMSLIYKSTPEDVQMIMIDPKVVELSVYNGIPHLMLPVVTDPKKASNALGWAVKEMELRYKKFADLNVRDLAGYNEKISSLVENDGSHFRLPKIVIIIDELADLMMVCGKEVEEAICRLAQLARACGIHLVVATQRPSVDVITGLIKANMPSRMAFAVSSGVDSRTILDTVGAEKLLGKGDMLFYPQGKTKPERVQGAFISDDEVSNVVDFLKAQRLHNDFAEKVGISSETLEGNTSSGDGKTQGAGGTDDGRDELFAEAGRCIINSGKASIGYLQRMLKIGFNRAARIMDNLAEEGVVGPDSGTKAREILMSIEEFESYLQE